MRPGQGCRSRGDGVLNRAMGSMMETSDAIPSGPVVPKAESIHDGYSSSTASSPEADVGPATQDVVQVQKRKGGRKPVLSKQELGRGKDG